jgi:hypothetical protein
MELGRSTLRLLSSEKRSRHVGFGRIGYDLRRIHWKQEFVLDQFCRVQHYLAYIGAVILVELLQALLAEGRVLLPSTMHVNEPPFPML